MYNLKIYFWALSILFFCNFESLADEAVEQSLGKADLEKQVSYALGYDIFEKLIENFELDPEYFIMGAKDSHSKVPKFTEEKLRELLVSYQRIARQKQIKTIKEESVKNKAAGTKFLDENQQKKGVTTLPSGLQYKVLTEGDGPLPKATDTVECHYKGTLIDGTVFDSSHRRGKPATFQVNGVIQGWIEALQLMKVGSRWMLYVPSELAYGDRGAGEIIKPGSTLTFEVELLGIVE